MAPADTRSPNTDKERPAVKNPVEARAGLISGHVITILIVGTILAIVLLGIVWVIAGA
jgi:hypothetical protein